MYVTRKPPANERLKQWLCMSLCFCLLFVATAFSEGNHNLIQKIEQHAQNKERVLSLLNVTPQLEIAKRFDGDFRESWRRILIDGPFEGIEKEQFLKMTLRRFTDSQQALTQALQSLLESHRELFRPGSKTAS